MLPTTGRRDERFAVSDKGSDGGQLQRPHESRDIQAEVSDGFPLSDELPGVSNRTRIGYRPYDLAGHLNRAVVVRSVCG